MWLLSLMGEKHFKMFAEFAFGAGGHASSGNVGAITFVERHQDAEWYCQVDNDTVPPNDVLRMLEGAPEEADIISPLVHMLSGGAIGPMQGRNVGTMGFIGLSELDGKGLCRVDRAGGGCIFIRRRVFEAMERPYFRTVHDNDTQVMTVSDDVFFQDRARELGFKMYCDTRYVAEHYHTIDLSAPM